MPSVVKIMELSHSAEAELRNLSKVLRDRLGVRTSPLALFYHILFAAERVSDVVRILNRLVQERKTLTDINLELEKVMPANWPPGVRFPRSVQRIFKRENDLIEHMKIDFESLYIFGNILLDQWAITVAYIAGLPAPGNYNNFRRLVKLLEKGEHNVILLTRLWEKLNREMLWLYYWLRVYRNMFIVHIDRPRQKIKTYRISGSNFQLYTPSPPGWVDKKEYKKEIRSLLQLLPQKLQKLPYSSSREPSLGVLLKHLFANIGAIPSPKDRERLYRLVIKIGISTPTFQLLGSNLLSFITEATKLLRSQALNSLDKVNVGRPAVSRKARL